MQLLNECLVLCRELKNIDEEIEEINSTLYTPKNQIISDMPRGRSNENMTDKLLTKKEHLITKKETIEKALAEKWEKVIAICLKAKVTKPQVQLLYLRFHEGKPWKECTKTMQERYIFWNDNKSFREYRSVLSKVHKTTEQAG